jgi:hypothetical protein
MAEEIDIKSSGIAQLTEQLKVESAQDKTEEYIRALEDLNTSVAGLSNEFASELSSLIVKSNEAIQTGNVDVQEELHSQFEVLKEIGELQKKRNDLAASEFTESLKQSELTQQVNETLQEQKDALQAIKRRRTHSL